MRFITVGIATGLIILLVLMLLVLAQGAAPAFARFGLRFFTSTQWNPVEDQFGALPFIYGTLVTSAIAILVALPVSVGLALLLNEVRSGWVRNPLAILVDLLAAIPSVIYGLWGIFVMAPALNRYLNPVLAGTLGRIPVIAALFQPTPAVGNMFNAGLILAIMIIPIITAVTREVIAIVPHDLREAALALGATRYESIRMAVLPYARSGIVGATMLGLGRALGETIAVSMLIGNGLGISTSLLAPGYTIPAIIANEFREATAVGYHRSALLALAIVLVAIAFLLAAVSRRLVGRTERMFTGAEAAEEPALKVAS
ncbi:MAG TPA: phosphate ABC transporter permease subunit PstC [Coriobacteriia bacterium]